MLRPNLTVEEARNELEGESDVYDWRLTRDDPFVVTDGEIDEVFSEGIKNGMLELDDQTGAEFYREENRVEGKVIMDALRLRRGIFHERFACQNDYRLYYKWVAWVNDVKRFYDAYYVYDFFREQLVNAVEHGSDWCRDGDVVSRVELAVNGLLAIIDQPCEGPDYEDLLANVGDRAFREGMRSLNEAGILRGVGMSVALDGTTPWIWGHELEDGGFRTIILETRERLLGLGV